MTVADAPIRHVGGSEPLRVVAARGDAALALLDDRWDDLVAHQPLPNPLLSAAWLRSLARWRTGVPFVVTAESGATLVAGAALELRDRRSRLGRTTATWLGPFEQLVAPDVLAHPASPHAPDTVLDAALGHADVLRLERTPADGAAATALSRVAPWVRTRQTGMRWVAPLPLPRRDHLQRRLASEIEKAERAGATVSVRIARDPDELVPALARMFRVHRGRWRDRPDEEARFATTRAHRSWNAHALAGLAAAGCVRLAEVVEDGQTVAADLGLVFGGGAVGHTTAMRRPVLRLEHPGHLSVASCLEELGEAGAVAVNLGVGVGAPGTLNHRLGARGEPVLVLVAASSRTRQRQLDALVRLRGAAARLR